MKTSEGLCHKNTTNFTRTVSVKKSISPQYAKRGSRRGDSKNVEKQEIAALNLLPTVRYEHLVTSSLLQATCCEAIQSVIVVMTLKKRLEKLCAHNGNYG
ncbi:MAG: hypothetical protein H9535_12025 [Ignavibacteria bacterium]|nr:hypothetical protein [Ignavibacteria bacterium]